MEKTASQPVSMPGELVLCRLLVADKAKPTASVVYTKLKPLLTAHATEQEARAWLNAAIEAYEDAGLLEAEKKGRSIRYSLSETGRRAALAFLGVDSVPRTLTWVQLQVYLVGRVLGADMRSAEARKRLAGASGLAGAILRQHYSLPLPPTPTQKEALDALFWQLLGVETQKAFTLAELKRHLLAQHMDAPETAELKQLQPALAARAVGARRGDKGGLQRALLERLAEPPREGERPHATGVVRDGEPASDDASSPSPPPLSSPLEGGTREPVGEPEPVHWEDETAREPVSLEIFAQRLHKCAAQATEGLYGQDKIFINHLYRQYKARYPEEHKLTAHDFKARLIEANRKGHIELARADLVFTMDPIGVAESETHHLNAVFHFMRRSTGE